MPRVEVIEQDPRIAFHMRSADGQVDIDLVAHAARTLLPDSCFASVSDASAFFEGGRLGFSVSTSRRALDAIVLNTTSWKVEPLDVECVSSSYFADRERFPEGSIRFDCGSIMRDIPHEWTAAAAMPL
jgi:hypothetical protein